MAAKAKTKAQVELELQNLKEFAFEMGDLLHNSGNPDLRDSFRELADEYGVLDLVLPESRLYVDTVVMTTANNEQVEHRVRSALILALDNLKEDGLLTSYDREDVGVRLSEW